MQHCAGCLILCCRKWSKKKKKIFPHTCQLEAKRPNLRFDETEGCDDRSRLYGCDGGGRCFGLRTQIQYVPSRSFWSRSYWNFGVNRQFSLTNVWIWRPISICLGRFILSPFYEIKAWLPWIFPSFILIIEKTKQKNKPFILTIYT